MIKLTDKAYMFQRTKEVRQVKPEFRAAFDAGQVAIGLAQAGRDCNNPVTAILRLQFNELFDQISEPVE